MATVNYSWNLPTVGGSEDTWGTSLNANWTDLDTLLGGVSQTEFAILDGATVTTAELNILDGVTGLSGADGVLVTGTAGTNGQVAQWNADGDIVGVDALNLSAVAEDIIPDADSTRDLGSSTKAWAEAHVDTVISTNVSDGTLSIPTTYVTNGSAKAWVNFNGTGTIAARDSLNVSSLTDNGTGDYTLGLTTATANANYSLLLTGGRSSGSHNSGGDMSISGVASPLTTTSARINSWRNRSTDTELLNDIPFVCAAIHGDLA
jgi:hypothetical protein